MGLLVKIRALVLTCSAVLALCACASDADAPAAGTAQPNQGPGDGGVGSGTAGNASAGSGGAAGSSATAGTGAGSGAGGSGSGGSGAAGTGSGGDGAAGGGTGGTGGGIAIPSAATLDCDDAQDGSVTWSLVRGPAEDGQCEAVAGDPSVFRCGDGSACRIAEPSAASTQAQCSMGDVDGEGAGEYVFRCELAGGAAQERRVSFSCPTPLPGYPQFCAEHYEASINSRFGGDFGTQTKPTFPSLPTGALEPVSVSDCAQLEAQASAGSKLITLSADLPGVQCVVAAARDVELDLAGHTIDVLVVSAIDDAATRLHVYDSVGGGAIGTVSARSLSTPATDLLLDGVRIGPDFASAATYAQIVAQNGSTALGGSTLADGRGAFARLAVVSSLVKGMDDGGSAPLTGLAGVLVGGEDVVLANTNISGGTQGSATTNVDDWAVRINGNGRALIVDSYLMSGRVKATMRTNETVQSVVYYTTLGAAGTARETTAAHVRNRNIEQNLANVVLHHDVRWYVSGELAFEPSSSFGRDSTTEYYYIYRLDAFSPMALLITDQNLTFPEAGALGADSNVDEQNTYSAYTDVPPWPAIEGGVSKGLRVSVGSDPYAVP